MSKKQWGTSPTVRGGPRQSDRQRGKAVGKDSTTNLTHDWLLSTRHALFGVIRPVGNGGFRSMGFVYDVLTSGHQVLCTARHIFSEDSDLRAYHFFQASHTPALTSPVHASPINAPDDYDLAFVVLPPTANRTRVLNPTHYQQWSPSTPEWIYNAKNIYSEATYPVDVMRQEVQPMNNQKLRAWCLLGGDSEILPTDDKAGPHLREDGYREYGLMNMYSPPGCSGSPVWDENLCLVGMNVKGSTEGGHCMAYLFAGDIRSLYERSRAQIERTIGL
jgi:hypothetical protein